MTVSVRDARTHRGDRAWIEGVYRDYLDDLSPGSTGMFPALGEIGHRAPDQLAGWFSDPSAQLLTILSDQQPAGFALVTPGGAAPSGGRMVRTDYRMAEFFIARSFRRRGVGRSAVRLVLDRFDGTWEIIEYLRNAAAVSFWRRVIALYTNGNYEERVVNGEVRQTFRSGARR